MVLNRTQIYIKFRFPYVLTKYRVALVCYGSCIHLAVCSVGTDQEGGDIYTVHIGIICRYPITLSQVCQRIDRVECVKSSARSGSQLLKM